MSQHPNSTSGPGPQRASRTKTTSPSPTAGAMMSPATEPEMATTPGWREVPSPGPRPLDQPTDPILEDGVAGDGGPLVDDDSAQRALRSTIGGRSQASTAEAARALTEPVGALVTLLGFVVHLARRRPAIATADGPLRVWVPNPAQAEAIAGPLASIAARRIPVGDGDTNDVVDGVMAGIAVTGYTIEQLELEQLARAQAAAETAATAGADG